MRRKALRSGLLIAVSVVILLSSTAMVRADSYTWEPGDTTNSWHHADNWDLTAVPGGRDTAYVDSGTAQVIDEPAYTGTVLVGAANSTAKIEATDSIGAPAVEVGYGGSSTGEISVANTDNCFNLSHNGSLKLGLASGASGKVSISNGAYLFSEGATTTYVGYAQGSTGVISLVDSDILYEIGSWVIYLGYAQGATGELSISGSEYGSYLTSLYVGNADNAIGTVSLSDGCELIVTDEFRVAYASGSTGDVSVSGAGTLLDGGLICVGHAGTGTFTQTGGSVDAALHIGGHESGAVGRYFLNGGVCNSYDVLIGEVDGTTGYLTVSDALLTCSSITVGAVQPLGSSSTSVGTYTQTGGSARIEGTFLLAEKSGNTGSGVLSGGTLKVDEIEVGSGTGSFEQTGGITDIDGDLTLAVNEGSNGTYELEGGRLICDGTMSIGDGTGTFTFTGGTLDPDLVGFNLTNSSGVLSPNGEENVGTVSFGNYDYTQGTAGVYYVDITSGGSCDLISSTGDFTFDGTVYINLVGDFTPSSVWFENKVFYIATGGTVINEGLVTGGENTGFASPHVVDYPGGLRALRLVWLAPCE